MATEQTIVSTLAEVPEPSAQHIAVRVTPAAERALREGHPWLYADSIREQSREGAPGDLGVVAAAGGERPSRVHAARSHCGLCARAPG